MESVKLSILIPSIPDRWEQLHSRLSAYQCWIDLYNLNSKVELLSIIDNKERSIGRKRSDLITIAEGRYIVITDDDDILPSRYFQMIAAAIDTNADVITYQQNATINKEHSLVHFRLKAEIGEWIDGGDTIRPAWHCCTWKREVVKDIPFPHINYGEDAPWAIEANIRAQTEHHIEEPLHYYYHDSTKTAAFL